MPTSYRLWNANTNLFVGELTNRSSYCINYRYNIEVIPRCRTWLKIWKDGGSVIARQKDEYEAPFYLWGKNGADVLPNPKKKPLPPGTYKVSNLAGGDEITFTQTSPSQGV